MRLLLLFTLCTLASLALSAQQYQAAQWKYVDAPAIVQGELLVPDALLQKEGQLRLRQQGETANNTDIAWVVSQGDTLFLRIPSPSGKMVLCQQIFSGNLALYRPIGQRKSPYLWIRSERNEEIVNVNTFFRQLTEERPGSIDFRGKNNPRGNLYKLVLKVEEAHQLLWPDEPYRSLLLETAEWKINMGLTTPLSLLQLPGGKRQHWSLILGIEKPISRKYSNIFYELSLQPFLYQNTEDLFFSSRSATRLYQQKWRLIGLQATMGLKMQFFSSRKISPFLGYGFNLVMPWQHQRYLAEIPSEQNTPGFPSEIESTGGIDISPGLYVHLGISTRISDRLRFMWQIALEDYFLKTDFSNADSSTQRVFRAQDFHVGAGSWSRWEALVQYKF